MNSKVPIDLERLKETAKAAFPWSHASTVERARYIAAFHPEVVLTLLDRAAPLGARTVKLLQDIANHYNGGLPYFSGKARTGTGCDTAELEKFIKRAEAILRETAQENS